MRRVSVSSIGKIPILIFIIYIFWYKEIWGDSLSVLYGTILFAFAILLLNWCRSPIGINRIPLAIKTYLLFGIYSVITGPFVIKSTSEFTSAIITFFAFTMVCFECWFFSDKQRSIKWIFNAILLAALLCAVSTIFWGVDFNNGVIVTTMSKTNNPNTLGYVMIIGIFSVLQDKKRLDKYLFLGLGCVAAFMHVIVLSGSRKCLIGASLLIFVWVFFYFAEKRQEGFRKKDYLLLSVFIIVILVAGSYAVQSFYSSTSYERLMLLFDEGGTTTRTNLYRDAITYWKSSPLLGIGFNQYRVWNGVYYSHSTYAEILSCSGIFGTLLFFVPVLRIGRNCFRTKKQLKSEKNNDYYYSVLICVLFGVELFLWIGQILIYNILHMLVLLLIDYSSSLLSKEDNRYDS